MLSLVKAAGRGQGPSCPDRAPQAQGEGQLPAWPGFAGFAAFWRRQWGLLMATSPSPTALDKLWGWRNLEGPSFSKVQTCECFHVQDG